MFLFLCLMSHFFVYLCSAGLISFFLEHSEPPLFMRPGGMWSQALSKPFWLPRTSPFGCTRIHSARPLSQTTRICWCLLYPCILCYWATSQFNFESFQAIGSNKAFRVLSSCLSPFTCREPVFLDIPVLFTPYLYLFVRQCPVQGYFVLPIPPRLKNNHMSSNRKTNGSEWHSSAELSRIFLVNICECQVWRLQCCFHPSFMALSALVHNMKKHLRLATSSDFVVGYFWTLNAQGLVPFQMQYDHWIKICISLCNVAVEELLPVEGGEVENL